MLTGPISADRSTRRMAGIGRSVCLRIDALDLDELWWLVSPGNPLKANAKGHGARFKARLASAQKKWRAAAPIRATAIEAREMGTRYSDRYVAANWYAATPIAASSGSWGRTMWQISHAGGAGAILHRLMPIAVIARPGYDAVMLLRVPQWPGSGGLSGVRTSGHHWTMWSTPALVFLRFRPDPRSATAIRQADPFWYKRYQGRPIRDGVTHKILV